MMNILKGLAICFSMYSIIPMPKVVWDKDSMKYTFCFFPVIGALIGALLLGWYWLASWLSLSVPLFSAAAIFIPIAISGGIHLDGFIDTCDAVFSYGDREKKLEILKDSRTGAFGVIGCATLFIMQFGLYAQLKETSQYIVIAATGFVVSRCFAALALVFMKPAKTSGLGYVFSNNSGKRIVTITASVLMAFALIFMAVFSIKLAIVSTLLLILAAVWFHAFCTREFGGTTGDLIGFIITIVECLILTVGALGGALAQF